MLAEMGAGGEINIIIKAACSFNYISDYDYTAQGFLAFDTLSSPFLKFFIYFFFLRGMLFIFSCTNNINTVKIILKGGKIGFKHQSHSSIN